MSNFGSYWLNTKNIIMGCINFCFPKQHNYYMGIFVSILETGCVFATCQFNWCKLGFDKMITSFIKKVDDSGLLHGISVLSQRVCQLWKEQSKIKSSQDFSIVWRWVFITQFNWPYLGQCLKQDSFPNIHPAATFYNP